MANNLQTQEYSKGGYVCMNKIKVTDLKVGYLGTTALQNACFQVNKGNMIGIIGPNGAGKSTLVKAMLGLVKYSGKISMDDNNTNDYKLTYMKQNSDYDLSFPITVKDVVMLGLYPSIGIFRFPQKKHRLLVDQALDSVEMKAFANRQISALSGGQWQRVLMARILVQNADIIFLDEPFAGVDVDSESKIISILQQLKALGKTIFIVHHDLKTVEKYFDEIILINKTVVAYGKTPDIFTDDNLKETYMRGGGL